MKSIYEFTNYRNYLINALGGERKRTGQRLALSKHLGCQTAFISRVLKEQAQLSLEQAFRANSFFNHDETASKYFLLMVEKEKAGTHELKKYFQDGMKEIIDQRKQISQRITKTEELNNEVKNRYYSHWLYAAIHMAVGNPKLQHIESLAEHFRISANEVYKVTNYLVEVGLVVEKNQRFHVGPNHIHLKSDSDQIVSHHTNWRLEALKSLNRHRSTDLHYSVVYSLSRAAAQEIREEILNLARKNLEIVKPSEEEVLFAHTIDFFEI